MNPLSLSITLGPGSPIEQIESPYHPIISIPDAEQVYHISLTEETVPPRSRLSAHLAPGAANRTTGDHLHRTEERRRLCA